MSKSNKFQQLGQYTYPPEPVRNNASQCLSWFKRLFSKQDEVVFVSEEDLKDTDQKKIDAIVQRPSYGSLLNELDETLKNWITSAKKQDQFKLIVLPYGDSDLVKTWAVKNNSFILKEPDRDKLLSGKNLDDFKIPLDQKIIVIPRLERWFLRHRNGLKAIRLLLNHLQEANVKCLIGCNSWAWQFLRKSLNAQYVLPEGLTFKPYTKDRLGDWFQEMAEGSQYKQVIFRRTKNGRDIFRCDDKNKLKSSFWENLAAKSLGIPWVAWDLWRHTLRSRNEEDNKDGAVVWVSELEEFGLPCTKKEEAMLVLHALLIHNTLTTEELYAVLPAIEHANVISLLLNADFIEKHDDQQLRCSVTAYPAIRSTLESAGFPLDRL